MRTWKQALEVLTVRHPRAKPRWRVAALAADFRSVDTTSPPLALFRMGQPTLLIETFVDFRNGVILVNAIREDIASVNLLN
jgi:hypothetical protein